MRQRRTTQIKPQSPLTRRTLGNFSDAARITILASATLLAAGCGNHPTIGGPGSPLGEARIDAVLPPNQPDPGARRHFEQPEYARRDRDLGLRR